MVLHTLDSSQPWTPRAFRERGQRRCRLQVSNAREVVHQAKCSQINAPAQSKHHVADLIAHEKSDWHIPTQIPMACRHEGFSKAGTVRTTTLHIMGLSMSAVRVSTLEILTPSSTKMIVNVECLKEGQKPCTADSDGNIGSGNKGKNNLGTKNVGNYNIGEQGLECKLTFKMGTAAATLGETGSHGNPSCLLQVTPMWALPTGETTIPA